MLWPLPGHNVHHTATTYGNNFWIKVPQCANRECLQNLGPMTPKGIKIVTVSGPLAALVLLWKFQEAMWGPAPFSPVFQQLHRSMSHSYMVSTGTGGCVRTCSEITSGKASCAPELPWIPCSESQVKVKTTLSVTWVCQAREEIMLFPRLLWGSVFEQRWQY